MLIKAAVFDFFGVLFKDRWKEFLYNYKDNLSEFLTNLEISYINDLNFPRKYPNYYHKLIQCNTDLSLSDKKISNDDFYSILSRASKLDSIEIRNMIHDTSVLNKEIIETINYLRQQHYVIGIITNGDNNIVSEFLKANHVEHLFDQIVTSEEAKVLKPSKLIYQLMLNRLNIEPQEMLFIDDSPINTQGARNLGILTIDYIDQSAEQLIDQIKEF